MTLTPKQEVVKKHKEEEDRLRAVKQDYVDFSTTAGGKDYIRHLTELAESYIRQAMQTIDRDNKATLIDTAAGVMNALNRMTEMSKPITAKRGSKRPQKGAKNAASQQ